MSTMAYEIKCPFCFKSFRDDEVHFRSEYVSSGDVCPDIPPQYDDFKDFNTRYKGDDKDRIIEKYLQWEFFRRRVDDLYNKFWNDPMYGFGGTTEVNSADQLLGLPAYERRVINPNHKAHVMFLESQTEDGDYYIRDADGFAISIKLKRGDICSRRVCPHCHNPLHELYGKFDVKFLTIVGITGSGKTVYLSQLIREIASYCAKIGMTAIPGGTSCREYVRNNPITTNKTLPGSTASASLVQPNFYTLENVNSDGSIETRTIVLYDVAGENCVETDLIRRFAPFIINADGILLLIDPHQFDVLSSLLDRSETRETASPSIVLESIHGFFHLKSGVKCDLPMAVCISKSDLPPLGELLDDDVRDMLYQSVEPIVDTRGFGQQRFNADDYNKITKGLGAFILNHDKGLFSALNTGYSCFNFFAFSALGCDINEDGYPIGPILPKRIEEPLFWMFYNFGFISTDEPVYSLSEPQVRCCNCNSIRIKKLEGNERMVRVGVLRRIEYNYHCESCGAFF